MKAAADTIKHVTLELGGKSPLIIFDDADLKNAVKGALMANFFTQGQVCSNAARVFVQRGIYSEFLKAFVEQAEKMKIGDPFNEDTTVGATICKEHAEKVLGYVQSAIDEGAKVECGGKRVLLKGNIIMLHSALKCAKKCKKFVKSLFTKKNPVKKCNLTDAGCDHQTNFLIVKCDFTNFLHFFAGTFLTL